MKANNWKRIGCFLMALLLVAGYFPVAARADYCEHGLGYEFSSNGDGTHDMFCADCREFVGTESCVTMNGGDQCDLCGGSYHDCAMYNWLYLPNGDGTHDEYCAYCQNPMGWTEACSDYDYDDLCDRCGGSTGNASGHVCTGDSYERCGDGTHDVYCSECGNHLSTENCTDADGNEWCDDCSGFVLGADHVCYEEWGTSCGDGTHDYYCPCGEYMYNLACEDWDEDGSCDKCFASMSGHACSRSWVEDNGDGTHMVYCDCGEVIDYAEACSGDYNEGYDNGTHSVYCECGGWVADENCTDADSDEWCELCGCYVPGADHVCYDYSAYECGDGTHNWYCLCGNLVRNEACYDNDGDEWCDTCYGFVKGPAHTCFEYAWTCHNDGTHSSDCACGAFLGIKNCKDTDGDSLCDDCNYCKHGSYWYEGNGDGTHDTFCNNCDDFCGTDDCDDADEDTCCDCCGYALPDSGGEVCPPHHSYIYNPLGNGGAHEVICGGCGETEESAEPCCDDDGDEYCDLCYASIPHTCSHYEYRSDGYGLHSSYCDCGMHLGEENCDYSGGTGSCDVCGTSCAYDHYEPCNYGSITYNGDGTHNISCFNCKVVAIVSQPCYDGDMYPPADGSCDVCQAPVSSGHVCTEGYAGACSNGESGGGNHGIYCNCGSWISDEACVDADYNEWCDKCGHFVKGVNHSCYESYRGIINGVKHNVFCACGEQMYEEFCDDVDGNGTCDWCSHCTHPRFSINSTNDGKHVWTCTTTCGTDFEWEYCYDLDANGFCDICSAAVSVACTHAKYNYDPLLDGTHDIYCADCGEYIGFDGCSDADEDTNCDFCGVAAPDDGTVCPPHHSYIYNPLREGIHEVICGGCGATENPAESCYDDDSDRKCDACGASVRIGGDLGNGTLWSYINGILEIFGFGKIPGFNFFTRSVDATVRPWEEFKDEIVSVEIGEGITEIGAYAFYDLTNLEEISLPDTLENIGAYSFCNTELSSVTLPAGLKIVETGAFFMCDSLEEITFQGSAPYFSKDSFGEVQATIYYPQNDSSWDVIAGGSFGGSLNWTDYDANGITIVSQPQSVTGEVGETVSVKVKAIGADLTYRWYFRNAGSGYWNVSSITTDTYSVELNKSRAGRELYCIITDAYGNVVKTEIAVIGSFPVIVTQPQSITVKKGELAVISVEAQGEGLTYQWYFRNPGTSYWNRSSETSEIYDITMTAVRANREYYCVITDRFGNKIQTETVKIGVADLVIVSQPKSSDAKKGETAIVTVEAEGEGLTYRWYFRNFGENRWNVSSIRTNTYSVVMNASRAGRELYCVITDAFGRTVTSDIATIGADLKITSQPQTVSGEKGETVTVTVEAEGEGLKYRWYLRNAGSSRFSLSSITSDTYSVVMNNSRANRELYCVVTDAYGRTVKTEVIMLILEE